ncbi:MAG: M4 family metallopeptidase [Planctomycetes bacterium]|nr:M4 family metallopeptidase [Planctomycetota bacterium]
MKTTRMTRLAVLLSLAAVAAGADRPQRPAASGIGKILQSTRPAQGYDPRLPAGRIESSRVATTRGGFLRTLLPPASQVIPAPAVVWGNPQATARGFFDAHAAAFGISHKNFALMPGRTQSWDGRTSGEFSQVYQGTPVAFASVCWQLNESGDIEYVSSDLLTEDAAADVDALLSVAAAVTAQDAGVIATAAVLEDHPELEFRAEPAALMIYQPAIIGNVGPVRLVWQTEVQSTQDASVAETVLVDAHTAEVALRFSLVKDAMSRAIYDTRYKRSRSWGIPVRQEGQPACGIRDADLAYDYVGDAFNFFLNKCGRDGLDGTGLTPPVYVHWGITFDAFWSSAGYMAFAKNCVADDAIAHEYTHGVVQYTCDFTYWGESGALDEMFADVLGEFADLTSDHGDDTSAVRWLIGEDLNLAAIVSDNRPALRNLKDPSAQPYCQPDRKQGAYWQDYRMDPSDNGGVHQNCSVGTKLACLLVDGGEFNGYIISEMGIDRIALLFYEVLTKKLLTKAADYEDLYFALQQAARNLGWTDREKQNLESACQAVQIAATAI